MWENVKINRAEGNQGSGAGRSEGWTDASSDRELFFFCRADAPFKPNMCPCSERSRKHSWCKIFVKNPKIYPEIPEFTVLERPPLPSRCGFAKQVVVPRYRGCSLICGAPLAEISIYINYLFNLVLLKQQNRIYNLQKKRFTWENSSRHPFIGNIGRHVSVLCWLVGPVNRN